MANYICVTGDVVIDDQLVYSSLYPVLGNFGLQLWRLIPGDPWRMADEGPHIDLAVVTPTLLINTSRDDLCDGATYSFSGPFLGRTRQFGGIAARDGSNARAILNLQLQVLYRDLTLSLSISGNAGPVHPSSRANQGCGFENQSLKIACAIPLALIPAIVSGRDGFFLHKKLECETTEEYLQAIKDGPPTEAK